MKAAPNCKQNFSFAATRLGKLLVVTTKRTNFIVTVETCAHCLLTITFHFNLSCLAGVFFQMFLVFGYYIKERFCIITVDVYSSKFLPGFAAEIKLWDVIRSKATLINVGYQQDRCKHLLFYISELIHLIPKFRIAK